MVEGPPPGSITSLLFLNLLIKRVRKVLIKCFLHILLELFSFLFLLEICNSAYNILQLLELVCDFAVLFFDILLSHNINTPLQTFLAHPIVCADSENVYPHDRKRRACKINGNFCHGHNPHHNRNPTLFNSSPEQSFFHRFHLLIFLNMHSYIFHESLLRGPIINNILQIILFQFFKLVVKFCEVFWQWQAVFADVLHASFFGCVFFLLPRLYSLLLYRLLSRRWRLIRQLRHLDDFKLNLFGLFFFRRDPGVEDCVDFLLLLLLNLLFLNFLLFFFLFFGTLFINIEYLLLNILWNFLYICNFLFCFNIPSFPLLSNYFI